MIWFLGVTKTLANISSLIQIVYRSPFSVFFFIIILKIINKIKL